MRTAGTLWVCTDCLMWEVNADATGVDDTGCIDPHDDETAGSLCDCHYHRWGRAVDNWHRNNPYRHAVPGGEHQIVCDGWADDHTLCGCDYDEFSSYPCNICNLPLAGSRHLMTVLEP